MTRVARTRAELDKATVSGVPVAVVMTMGALHEGHAELMREARRRSGCPLVARARVRRYWPNTFEACLTTFSGIVSP